jgi:hypothetical protein
LKSLTMTFKSCLMNSKHKWRYSRLSLRKTTNRKHKKKVKNRLRRLRKSIKKPNLLKNFMN